MFWRNDDGISDYFSVLVRKQKLVRKTMGMPNELTMEHYLDLMSLHV